MIDIKVFLKKRKSGNMVASDAKNLSEHENKIWLNIEKNIIKWEKTPYYNYKKLLSFRKFDFFLGLGLVSGLYEIRMQVEIKTFFYLHLGLESSLSTINQHSSWAKRNLFILHLISSYPGV